MNWWYDESGEWIKGGLIGVRGGESTYRYVVNKEHNEDDDKDEDETTNEVPLVVPPDDVLERLERWRKPEEWRLWTSEK